MLATARSSPAPKKRRVDAATRWRCGLRHGNPPPAPDPIAAPTPPARSRLPGEQAMYAQSNYCLRPARPRAINDACGLAGTVNLAMERRKFVGVVPKADPDLRNSLAVSSFGIQRIPACSISHAMISALCLVEPARPERPSCPDSMSVLSSKSRRSVLHARSRATHLAGSA